MASALAIKEYHALNQGGKIGIVLNLTPAYPRSENPADVKAAQIAELFANKSFLDPSVKGEYDPMLIEIIKKHDLMPTYTEEDNAVIKENTVDFLGVTIISQFVYVHVHLYKSRSTILCHLIIMIHM